MKSLGYRRLMLVAFGIALVSGTAAHGQPIVPAVLRQSPLDQPIAWLEEAKRNHTAVKDYTCTLVTQERVKDRLLPRNVIQLKLKTEPFSVHMRWIGEGKHQGQEVYYVRGKNNGKMRVKNTRIFPNIIGFYSVDPNDPRVFENSRHTILEAGIGHMIEESLIQWQKDRLIGKTNVAIRPYIYNNRKCDRIELTRTVKNAAFAFHRTVIYLEKESKLPIRLENYAWPRAGGLADDLVEEFSYINLQFNVGLRDADFNK